MSHVTDLEALGGRHLRHMRADTLSRLLLALRAAQERVEAEMARRRPEHYELRSLKLS